MVDEQKGVILPLPRPEGCEDVGILLDPLYESLIRRQVEVDNHQKRIDLVQAEKGTYRSIDYFPFKYGVDLLLYCVPMLVKDLREGAKIHANGFSGDQAIQQKEVLPVIE